MYQCTYIYYKACQYNIHFVLYCTEIERTSFDCHLSTQRERWISAAFRIRIFMLVIHTRKKLAEGEGEAPVEEGADINYITRLDTIEAGADFHQDTAKEAIVDSSQVKEKGARNKTSKI